MVERTVLAQDVQSILKQNDKILELNREIFEFIKETYKPMILNMDKLDIDIGKMKPGDLYHRASSML